MRQILLPTLVLATLTLTACGGSEPTEIPVLPPVAETTPSSVGGAPDYRVIDVDGGGRITGTILVSGAIPSLPDREVDRDPEVCGRDDREALELLVAEEGGLANVLVLLEGISEGKPMPEPEGGWRINQSGCDYSPHVQIVPTNVEFSIVNSDPILHNIHSYLNDETEFNIAQPVQNQINTHTFTTPGFIYTECDVHSWMQAHIVAVDNPYFAITDDTGRFLIDGVPAGTYTARIWHEFLGERTAEVTVSPGADATLDRDFRDLLDEKMPPDITTAPPEPGATEAAQDGPAAVVIVEMQSQGSRFQFAPADITIKVGTTVQWVNASRNRHSSTSDPQFEKQEGQAIRPPGVEPWSSVFLTNSQTFGRTFDTPGEYRYFCRNHEQFGMLGTITVEP